MKEVIEPVEAEKDTTVEEPTKPVAEAKEQTISEAFETKKEDTVPLSTFLEIKKESKATQREIADLKKQIEEGATKKEISKGIKEIAAEHDVNEDFLNELVSTIKAEAEKETDKRITSKLKPLQEKERADKIDTIFNTQYAKTLETMPEYDGIINKDVIKSLVLDPKNQNKTFTKIIEESFGHLITGKKTIESSSPTSSKNDGESLDKSKLKDPAYMSKVMANPTLKAEYNKGLIERLNM